MTAAGIHPSQHKVVAVVGGGQCNQAVTSLAEEVGREIARQGAVLICGGLGGVMEAACRGAMEADGLTVGILPGSDRHEANSYLSVAVATGLGHARNVCLVQSADVVIAVGGGYGTLSEIAIALKAGIPVIGLDTWSISRAGQFDSSPLTARSASEAVKMALSSIKKAGRKRTHGR